MKSAATIRIAIVAGFFVLLELLTRLGVISPNAIVAPSDMVERLLALFGDREFWSQLGFTATCIAASLLASVVAGFILGVLVHRAPRLRMALEPLISSYYALPFLVLYPLFIVLLGMNALPIIFVGFIYGFMAMLTATLSGLDRIPPVFRRVGRTLQLSRAREALLIQLPAAWPYLLTGIKLALGYAITGVIGSEFILSNNGFGYAIAYSYNNFDDTTMYARLLFLIVIVTAMTVALNAAEGRIHHRGGAARQDTKRGSLPERLAAGAAIIASLLLLWELLYLKVGSDAFASPAATASRLGQMLLGAYGFWDNVAETGIALGLSLIISCAVGTLVGIALGLSPFATAIVEPILVTIYALPKVTLYPVVLLFFGIGLAAKIAFGTLYGMIPMVLITINAVANINPSLH